MHFKRKKSPSPVLNSLREAGFVGRNEEGSQLGVGPERLLYFFFFVRVFSSSSFLNPFYIKTHFIPALS